jgi:hypothetical protein
LRPAVPVPVIPGAVGPRRPEGIPRPRSLWPHGRHKSAGRLWAAIPTWRSAYRAPALRVSAGKRSARQVRPALGVRPYAWRAVSEKVQPTRRRFEEEVNIDRPLHRLSEHASVVTGRPGKLGAIEHNPETRAGRCIWRAGAGKGRRKPDGGMGCALPQASAPVRIRRGSNYGRGTRESLILSPP